MGLMLVPLMTPATVLLGPPSEPAPAPGCTIDVPLRPPIEATGPIAGRGAATPATLGLLVTPMPMAFVVIVAVPLPPFTAEGLPVCAAAPGTIIPLVPTRSGMTMPMALRATPPGVPGLAGE